MPSEPSDCRLRLKSSRKGSWPFASHSPFFLRRLQAGKSWFSGGCSKRCACRAGVIQCGPFACPSGSQCQPNKDGKDYCAPESKGALGEVEPEGPGLGALEREGPGAGRSGPRLSGSYQLPGRLHDPLWDLLSSGQKEGTRQGDPLKLGEGESGRSSPRGAQG